MRESDTLTVYDICRWLICNFKYQLQSATPSLFQAAKLHIRGHFCRLDHACIWVTFFIVIRYTVRLYLFALPIFVKMGLPKLYIRRRGAVSILSKRGAVLLPQVSTAADKMRRDGRAACFKTCHRRESVREHLLTSS
jgi:hypothetical protein